MTHPKDQDKHPLEVLFRPRSVAVVGASQDPESQGWLYLKELLEFPFKGEVYPVTKGSHEILGARCYESLGRIEGPVDHVISCVPYHQVLSLVEECVQKGVRCLHLYTARLAETQLQDRRDLEKEIVRSAREGGMRVIGPNCMGIYCPASGLTFRMSLPRDPGHVAFLSQSGGNAADLEYQGAGRGLRFSKIVSFGNAADLNECDFLDYLLEDPETRFIGMYLEGVKEGRRFVKLLEKARDRKPIVAYKAGKTRSGARAVATHTASLSGEAAVWDALFRQHGVIAVDSIAQMADVLLAFQFLRPPAGRRLLVMGGGGGGSVSAADVCEREGFVLPPLPEPMREEIRAFAPDVWSLVSNPMDGSVMGGLETLVRSFQMGAQWNEADVLLGNSSAVWLLDHEQGAERHDLSVKLLIDLARNCGKPMALYVNRGDPSTPWRVDAFLRAQEFCAEAGIPVYPNVQRAARALSAFVGYHERMRNNRG